ncbi:MAG: hypothetical protein AABN95_20280 [Acidobacteriota bacterium]
MRHNSLAHPSSILLAIISIFVCSQTIVGQEKCLTQDEIKNMVAQVNLRNPVILNKKLRDELLRKPQT